MRILVFFPYRLHNDVKSVQAGEAPRDRLYGMAELTDAGIDADFTDRRFEGTFGRIVKWFRRHLGCNLVDLKTLWSIRQYDAVVVKDNFSTLLTLACRLMGRKLIYVDAMFQIPNRRLKRGLARLNILLAAKTVAYSRTQIDLWADRLRIPHGKLQHLPYVIDTTFYPRLASQDPERQAYVLSVGRDLGRDFKTLAEAMEPTGLELKLITLPYLLDGVPTSAPWIEIRQYVSYDELFDLYAGASVVVVPLHRGISYPAGVRAMLEAMAVGRPVVATRTPVLLEYTGEGDEVVFVDPCDPIALREAILKLHANPAPTEQLARAQRRVRESYGMDAFVERMRQLVEGVVQQGK